MGIGEMQYYKDQEAINEKELHRSKISLNIILNKLNEQSELDAIDLNEIKTQIIEIQSFLEKIKL